MIWGLTLEPGRLYPISLDDDEIQLSMAALESRSDYADSESSVMQKAKVMVHTHHSEFLLCTLVHGTVYQQALDMKLRPKDKLSLSILGYGTVHITGYTNEYVSSLTLEGIHHRSKGVYSVQEKEVEPPPPTHDPGRQQNKSVSRRKKANPQKTHQSQDRNPFTERQQVVLLKQITTSEMRKQVAPDSQQTDEVIIKTEPMDEDEIIEDQNQPHDDFLEETFAGEATHRVVSIPDMGGWIEEGHGRTQQAQAAQAQSQNAMMDADEVDDLILNDLFPELAGGTSSTSPNKKSPKQAEAQRKLSSPTPRTIKIRGSIVDGESVFESILKCKHCNRNFPSEFELRNHEALHQHKCVRCKKLFTTVKNLRRHGPSCTGSPASTHSLVIKIPQPAKTIRSPVTTPRKRQTTPTRFGVKKCRYCSKGFPTDYDCESHEKLHRHPCKRCRRLFTTVTNLKRHRMLNICTPYSGSMPPKITPYKAAHKIVQHVSPVAATSSPIKSSPSATPNKCKFCTRTYPTEKEWREHEALHIHPCPLCKKMFTSRKSLRAHELHKKCPFLNRPMTPDTQGRIEGGNLNAFPPRCLYCRKLFETVEEVREHEKTHVYKCQYCEKIYTSSGNLKKHKTIMHPAEAAQERVFRCRFCPKTFSSQAGQIKHETFHKGIKLKLATKSARSDMLSLKTKAKYNELVRVKCELCSKRLTAKNMKFHMLLHRGEKPYKCLKCERAYASGSGLRKHQRKCNAPSFKCKTCQKTFSNRTSLVRHEIIHTSLQPYKCSFCPRAFNSNSSWRRHEQNIHNNGAGLDKVVHAEAKENDDEINVMVDMGDDPVDSVEDGGSMEEGGDGIENGGVADGVDEVEGGIDEVQGDNNEEEQIQITTADVAEDQLPEDADALLEVGSGEDNLDNSMEEDENILNDEDEESPKVIVEAQENASIEESVTVEPDKNIEVLEGEMDVDEVLEGDVDIEEA